MRIWATTTVTILCLGIGCVYYNTFYHAERYYQSGLREVERAEGKVTQKAEDDFKKSIEKCAKVLTRYPGSSYVDEALLLMGKALFQRADYQEAIQTFDKLVTAHPEGDKVVEALYWKAKAEFQEKLYTDCLMTIDRLDGREIEQGWAEELAFLRGETYYCVEDYRSCYDELQRLISQKSSSRWRDEGLLRMAQSQFHLGLYDEALTSFQDLVETATTLSLKREGHFWIASSFSEIGRYREAADAYQKLLEGELSEQESLRARIGLGRQLVLLGEIDEALRVFELLTFDHPKTPEAAEANYLRGKIFLQSLRESDRAREEFKKGFRQSPNSEYGRLCQEEWREVERWKKLRDFVGDDVPDPEEELAQARFLIAEFYLYQLKDLEKALDIFRMVSDSFPESFWAAKSIYARGWILEKDYGDTASSYLLYRELIDRFPDTRYADHARLKLNMELPERPIGFYEDEAKGELLQAAVVEGDITLIDEAVPTESAPDTLSAAPPDTLSSEESVNPDSLPPP